MGQYYIICNLDKRQFLMPHKFGNGLKLCEFGASGFSTMFGLAALLADGNGRGGGDLPENDLIGSWAGDRIVVAGDYADKGKFLTPEQIVLYQTEQKEDHAPNVYNYAHAYFEDISFPVLKALCADNYTKQEFAQDINAGWASHVWGAQWPEVAEFFGIKIN